MKKFFALAATALLITTSCSSDSETAPINNVDTNVLLKKAIVTTNDSEPVTAEYSYHGNELEQVQYSNGIREEYTYNAQNLIKNIKHYINNELVKNEDLTYHQYNSIIKDVTTTSLTDISESGKTTYLLNDRNEIVVRIHGLNEQNQHYLIKQQVMIMNGSNISQITTSGSLIETLTYTYDSKNSPFRNITGNKFMVMARLKGGANNMINYIKSGAVETESSTVTYTYNNNNFPITSTETKSNGDIITTQYFYE